MKKLLPLLLLPLLVFIACSDDDDIVDACNELVTSLNEAQTAWVMVEMTWLELHFLRKCIAQQENQPTHRWRNL